MVKNKLEDGLIVDDKIIKECKDGIRKHLLDTQEVLLRGEHNYEKHSYCISSNKNFS